MTQQPNATPRLSNQIASNTPLLMIGLLLVDSLHFVFGRLLTNHFSPAVSSMWMISIGFFEIFLFMAATRRISWQILRDHWRFFTVIGLLISIATIISFTAIQYIDPGTASLLARTSTVFSLGLGVFWLKDHFTLPEAFGAALAILGAVIISFQPGDLLRWGSLLILTSAFSYTLHTAVVKKYGDEIEFANFFLYRNGFTALFLALFVIGSGEFQLPATDVWGLLLLAGTVDVVISRILYYLALRRLQLSHHAVLLTLAPVAAIIWSLILFGETPTEQGLLGGLVVIAGIIALTWGSARKKQVQPT